MADADGPLLTNDDYTTTTPAESYPTMPVSKLALAGGSIMPILEKLFVVDQGEAKAILKRLVYAIHPGDLIVLGFLSLFTVPLCRFVFGKKRASVQLEDDNGTYVYQVGSHIAQIARLALIVYVFDCFVIILTTIGFDFMTLTQMSKGFAKILYITWCGQRLCVFKRYLLYKSLNVSGKKDPLGRLWAINRILDFAIVMVASFILLEILDVDMGMGVKSIFAFGSAGTLVVGLASKDMAAMFVNGLLLTTSNRISENDHIKLGQSGLSGVVEKIGWFQTTLRHYNNQAEIIPNSELGMQRVTNLSRVDRCQLKQDIRIQFQDYHKIELILKSIKAEIKESCPTLISDGSKPFRAYVVAIREDHIRASIECHFNLPPFGEQFWNNRHEWIMAILRAASKNQIEFVSGLYPNGINQ